MEVMEIKIEELAREYFKPYGEIVEGPPI